MKVKFYTRRQCQHLLPKMLLLFVLLILGNLSYAQGIQVTGSVTSVEGDPLIGASVVVEGTTNGAIADFDGKFSLNAPKNAVLIISSVGYTSQKVTLNGQTVINVKLAADIKTLGEVVVIGYGTQRKETVTGSVASIGGEELNQVASSNITQALQGRVSGVELSANSSKPGAAMQIRIRGTRSLNASNDPLIVLDGIPFGGTIGDINPSDIKSLDILKDASATAIYGSRGANGVILITTTKGKKGQKPRISYSGYQGIKTVFAKYPMMSGEKLSKLRADAGVYSTNGLDEVAGTNTDWQDLMYSSAMTTSHDLSVSGGTEKSNYKFGLGYYKDESVLPNEDYSRLSLRSSIDQEINDYISVGFTSNNSYSVTNNGRGIYSILSASPLVNPYNTDGSFKRMFSMPADDAWTETRSTLEALGDKSINQSRGVSSYNSVYAEVKIPGVEGLKFRTNVGLNFNQGNGGSYTGEGVFSTNPSTLSSATVSNSRGTGWTSENLLTYDRVFAEKHRINVVALYSAEKSTYNRSHMTVKGVTSDAFQFY
ncbi:MAG: hypothetical protein RIS47_1375, partial [Bacteroidota bacterium]